MIISYKHLRINYIYTNINIWTNHTQYYRTLLRAHSICMPSVMQYILVYSNNSNRIEFKSRQLANIIGKFVYYYIRLIKIYSYFYRFFKQIIDTKTLKKVYHYKIYRGKKLIFTLNLKHFILLIRNKIRIRLKKNRYFLWKLFYNIPNSFWNNSAKKRVKSIIWLIFFTKNQPKISKQYLNKNEKIKGNLFFFSYNKISSLVYNAFNRKRIPKKEWLIKKNDERKKKIKRKFGIYFNSNIYEDVFTNANNIKTHQYTFNQLENIYNNKYNINLNYYNNNNNISIIMYCYLLFYIKLNKISNYNLNLYYLYISYIYKKRIINNIINTYSHNTNNINIKSNSHNTFNFHIWYNLFMKEHNIYTYFNINSVLIYKTHLYTFYNYLLIIKKYVNNTFFITKNTLLTNQIYNSFYKNQYYTKIMNRNNIKKLSLKKIFIKRKIHVYTIIPIIYKKILNKINIFRKKKYINTFKTINILGKNMYINNKINIKKIPNKRAFIKRFYNIYKHLTRNIRIYNNSKYLVVINNKLNNLFLNSYKMRNFNNNKISYIKKNYKKIIVHNRTINKHTYKYINNINIFTNNALNNILIYKKIINVNSNLKYNLDSNSNYIIQNYIGLDTKIIYSNDLLYIVYFNNNIIYKEIITEYNIRIHNKHNKYDHLFILHKNIIIFINKKNNIGNINNGIHLYMNCFYINNNINYISLLHNINKYLKLLVIPIFNNINKYYILNKHI
jgi:hypothetical protein